MAIWVVRLLDGQEPPAVTQTTFADVAADSFYAPFIERMAELDVTRGCGDGSGFCPDGTVNRAQMAAFLSRAYGLADGPDPGFTDVADDAWYAADVARLAASGITKGCGDGNRFCPGRTTTRAEMATFLHRAENPGEAEEAEQPSDTSVQLNSAMDGGGIISRGPCVVKTDGTITCWNNVGVPETDNPSGTFTAVSSSPGSGQSCGIRTDATIACWGQNYLGQADAPSGTFIAVSAGNEHSCAVRTDGTIICWGEAYIPPGLTVHADDAEDRPGGYTAAAAHGNEIISAGGLHSCGLLADRSVACWGDHLRRTQEFAAFQCLGMVGGEIREFSGFEFLAVSAGGAHSCGLLADQTVTCSGVRGQNAPRDRLFLSVSAGGSHSCGLVIDQTVTCWGNDHTGERDAPMLRFLDETDTSTSASILMPRPVDCHQQAASAGKPGPPSGVQIVRVDLLSGLGGLLEPATVGWARPCSGGSVDHYVVRWRRGHEDFSDDSQHIVRSSDTTEAYSLEIPDLRAFAVRVTAVNRDGQGHSAEVMVRTPANEVRALLEDVIVTFEDRYPWLSEVGTRMNRSDFAVGDSTCIGGHPGCAQSDSISIVGIRGQNRRWDEDDEQEARRSGRILDTLSRGSTAVHEMAHVYHHLTDLAVNPPAIAAGWMYLNEFLKDSDIVQGGDCRTQELYADIPGILMAIDGLSVSDSASYWSNCRSQQGKGRRWPYDDNRWQELLDVMRSVYVHQEVPQWFYDTYQRADSNWDVDAIKETLGFYTEKTGTSAGIYWRLRQLIPDL